MEFYILDNSYTRACTLSSALSTAIHLLHSQFYIKYQLKSLLQHCVKRMKSFLRVSPVYGQLMYTEELYVYVVHTFCLKYSMDGLLLTRLVNNTRGGATW